MRIYRMTATFGKLRHETLTLEPGLNIIEAPNEWGKSTWCAFLMAMLYGLDTRSKTTKSALADKERYMPWSGELMAGRIDLQWRGRDITIERATRRRVPLGEFKAYETASGLPVSELTAANCGEWLLGVEQPVFRRSGFIRFSDLPVTQDETLRSRLNALVTTGDESGDAERLSKSLRDLKNRCRYNKKGLLPQAEEQMKEAEGKLRELETLLEASRDMKQRQQILEEEQQALENHLTALDYAEAVESARRVALSKETLTRAEEALARCAGETDGLPSREQTLEKLPKLEALIKALEELPGGGPGEEPLRPELPEPFRVEDPRAMLREDQSRHRSLGKSPVLWWCLAGALALAGVVLGSLKLWIWALAAVGLGALILAVGMIIRIRRREKQLVLEEKYGSRDRELWEKPLAEYDQALSEYQQRLEEDRLRQEELLTRRQRLEEEEKVLCGEVPAQRALEVCRRVLERWTALEEARKEYLRCREHFEAISAVARPVPPAPEREDPLTCTREEARLRLSRLREEQWSLQNRLGRNQGRMQTLGSPEELEQDCIRIRERIRMLEDTYAALTLAQETLALARQELQRRFAPQIVRRARELMLRMTSGRYNKLSLEEDLSITAGAGEEETLSSILWRSDGTVDQLYLALRLAVAEALTPQAPLILDDALVRFDDARLGAALDILREMAEEKQILLFTCQSREKNTVQ